MARIGGLRNASVLRKQPLSNILKEATGRVAGVYGSQRIPANMRYGNFTESNLGRSFRGVKRHK